MADTGEDVRDPFGWVWRAHEIAQTAHDGQVDKSGEPYIGHPRRVALAVAEHGPVYEAAALLHDVVEDTEVTLADLRDQGMPDDVVRAVDALSHRVGEPRRNYYNRVSGNHIARVVKRADIEDNLSPERLARLDDATADRLRAKYAEALARTGR